MSFIKMDVCVSNHNFPFIQIWTIIHIEFFLLRNPTLYKKCPIQIPDLCLKNAMLYFIIKLTRYIYGFQFLSSYFLLETVNSIHLSINNSHTCEAEGIFSRYRIIKWASSPRSVAIIIEALDCRIYTREHELRSRFADTFK